MKLYGPHSSLSQKLFESDPKGRVGKKVEHD